MQDRFDSNSSVTHRVIRFFFRVREIYLKKTAIKTVSSLSADYRDSYKDGHALCGCGALVLGRRVTGGWIMNLTDGSSVNLT